MGSNRTEKKEKKENRKAHIVLEQQQQKKRHQFQQRVSNPKTPTPKSSREIPDRPPKPKKKKKQLVQPKHQKKKKNQKKNHNHHHQKQQKQNKNLLQDVSTTSNGTTATATVPDPDSSPLDRVLTAEVADVTGMLGDLDLPHLLPEGGTIPGTVFTSDSDLLGSLGLRLVVVVVGVGFKVGWEVLR